MIDPSWKTLSDNKVVCVIGSSQGMFCFYCYFSNQSPNYKNWFAIDIYASAEGMRHKRKTGCYSKWRTFDVDRLVFSTSKQTSLTKATGRPPSGKQCTNFRSFHLMFTNYFYAGTSVKYRSYTPFACRVVS